MKHRIFFLVIILSVLFLQQVVLSENESMMIPNLTVIQTSPKPLLTPSHLPDSISSEGKDIPINTNPLVISVSKNKSEWVSKGSEEQIEVYNYSIMPITPDKVKNWYTTKYRMNQPVLIPHNITDISKSEESKSLLSLLNYIPIERDQANCGNCWVWSGTGAIEIAHTVNMNASDRLSIQYVNSNYHNGGLYPFSTDDFACNGGFPDDIVEFYAHTGKFGGNKTLIPWSNDNASFSDIDGMNVGHTVIPASSIQTDPHYNISSVTILSIPTQGITWKQAKENIKYCIDQNQGVILFFYLPDGESWIKFKQFWQFGDEESDFFKLDQFAGKEFVGGGHTVLITGYRDYGDHGYWECLNSWGTPENRSRGIFYIDMNMDYSASYSNEIPVALFETINLEESKVGPVDLPDQNFSLTSGWNLISTPKNLRPGNDTFSIFKGVKNDGHSIYYYDSLKGWKKVNASDIFKPLIGVWIYSSNLIQIPLYYDKNSVNITVSRSLHNGWNTIGSPASFPINLTEGLVSVEEQWKYLVRYNSSAQKYDPPIIKDVMKNQSDAIVLDVGEGYWLYMETMGNFSTIN